MNAIAPQTVTHIVAQTDFISKFGTYLTKDVRLGLAPYDIEANEHILYGPVDGEMEPLHPIVNIDGSPRQGNVRWVTLPDSKMMAGSKGKTTPFHADVHMLQKSIELPLRALFGGLSGGMGGVHTSEAEREAFEERLEMVGDMDSRSFLAEHLGKGAEDRTKIIAPVATDLYEIALRMIVEKGNSPDVYMINSAMLFAALDDTGFQKNAVQNFASAAASLFDAGNFVASAIIAELAMGIDERHPKGVVTYDESKKIQTIAARGWFESLETDLNQNTYPLRLYRGMRNAWDIPDSGLMDKFLEKAMNLEYSNADFERVAETYMRRAFYAVRRSPMTRYDWTFVRAMINGAAVLWIGQGGDESHITVAQEFARVTEKLELLDES